MSPGFFPRCTVHLDFHTGRGVPELADFEPESSARTTTLQPAGTPLPLRWAHGVAATTVTVLDGHARSCWRVT